MNTIDNYIFNGKKALIRVDFNVPLNDKFEITDTTRIDAAIPTIQKILDEGGSVILMSHLGRPKTGPEDKFSLKHLLPYLSQKLNKDVKFADDCIGDSAKELAELERIDEYDTQLLLTAALYHDSGMIIDYENHEEESVKICEKELPKFGYSETDIKTIARLIRKTKLFEKADCILENIICDSDLDYLGRDYFFIRSTKLHYEWKLMGKHDYNLVEWLKIQVDFLENHHFYTKSAQKLRENTKRQIAQEIRNLYKICPDNIS